MPRLIPLVALVLGLVVAVPSAAQVGAGRIAFTTPDGLYTADADGTGVDARARRGGLDARGLVPGRLENRLHGLRPSVERADARRDERRRKRRARRRARRHRAGTRSMVGRRQQGRLGAALQHPRRDLHRERVGRRSSAADVRRARQGPAGMVARWLDARVLRAHHRCSGSDRALHGGRGRKRRSGAAHADRLGPDDDYGPAWSPTGDAIAFVRQAQPDRPGIFIINRDGSNLRRVWTDGFLPGGPTWSPDGSRILFSTSINGRPTKYTIGREVYSVDRDGTHTRGSRTSGRSCGSTQRSGGHPTEIGSFSPATSEASGR